MLAAASLPDPTSPSRLNPLGRLLALLLLIAAAAAFYYYVLIEHGTDHVYRRNFRTLAQIETQIDSGFERIRDVAATTEHGPFAVDGRIYPTSLTSSDSKGMCSPPDTEYRMMRYEPMLHGSDMHLNFFVARSCKEKPYKIIKIGSVPLANLVDFSDALERFHQVFLFDGNRKIILTAPNGYDVEANVNIYNLLQNNTTTHESMVEIPDDWIGAEGDPADDKKQSSGDTKKDNGNNGRHAGKGNNEPKSLPLSKIKKFTIGGQKYMAFIRPMVLPYAEMNQNKKSSVWYAVGITTEDEFNTSRFILPRWWVAVMILSLLSLGLNIPYIKLKLLGPHELIQSTTIAAAACGLILAVVLGVTIVLNWCAYYLAYDRIEGNLATFGKKISTEFNNEYSSRTRLLGRVMVSPESITAPKNENTAAGAGAHSRAPDKKKGAVAGSSSRPDPGINEELGRWPFSYISIFDENGTLYAITPKANTNNFSISDRKYWKDYKRNQAIKQIYGEETYEQITLNSSIDGYKKTIIAKNLEEFPGKLPSKLKRGDWWLINTGLVDSKNSKSNQTFTFMGSFRYLSLDNLIFPKGYGFIVVRNSTGAVQYHSEEHHNLTENLYEETDNNRALKAAISSREPDTLQINYRGSPYVFTTQPLADGNWTLVTYFNREFLDKVNLGLLLTAIGPSCAYLILLALAMVIGFKFLSLTRVNHLWPNPRQTGDYANLAAFLFVQLVTTAIAIQMLQGNHLLLALAATPALALSGTYILLVDRYRSFDSLRGSGRESPDWRPGFMKLTVFISGMIVFAQLDTPATRHLLFIPVALIVLLAPIARFYSRKMKNSDRFCASDRRSDRTAAHRLHRLCITLLILLVAILPTLAFYRDSTALYVLRWNQQDAQKQRHELERLAYSPNLPIRPASNDSDYHTRLQKILAYNERIGLTLSEAPQRNCIHSEPELPESSSTQLTPPPRLSDDNQPLAVEQTITWPILKVSAALSSEIFGLSRETPDPDSEVSQRSWHFCGASMADHMISALPIANSSFSPWLQQRWAFRQIGYLEWSWIWLGVGLLAALVIFPVLRLILRELVADADLRPHPTLSRTELDLLCSGWHGLIILVSANTLGARDATPEEIETRIIGQLRSDTFADHPLRIDRLRYPIERPLPDIFVVAERNWGEIDPSQLQRPNQPRDELANKQLETMYRLRLPDDLSSLALGYWRPIGNFTLLICNTMEAQNTLAAKVKKEGADWRFLRPGDYWAKGRIWIGHVESILHHKHQRQRLLYFLESARAETPMPTVVMTSLVLPHLWVADSQLWIAGEGPDMEEQSRWLTVLAGINVRSVSTLDKEHELGELGHVRHALPRAACEAEYESWWRYSTPDEQLALAALAHEGIINPLNRTIIRSLMARRLIFRRRALHFSDHGFELFVKQRFPAPKLHRSADRALQNSSWGEARGPLFVGIALLGYGIMVMGGGAVETVLGLVTSIGASVPALLNIARLLRRDGVT